MRKSLWAIIAIIVLVIIGVGIWLGTSNNSTSNTNTTNTPGSMNMPSSTSQNSNTTPAATNAVTIQNFAFNPSNITVKKGTTVTWTNNDSTTHTVTETDSQTGPDSGDLSPGKSYSFTFNATGTFHYHCSIHPSMTGTVIVTD